MVGKKNFNTGVVRVGVLGGKRGDRNRREGQVRVDKSEDTTTTCVMSSGGNRALSAECCRNDEVAGRWCSFSKYRFETRKKFTSIITSQKFEKNLRFPRLLCHFSFVTSLRSYILVRSLRRFRRLLRYNLIKI